MYKSSLSLIAVVAVLAPMTALAQTGSGSDKSKPAPPSTPPAAPSGSLLNRNNTKLPPTPATPAGTAAPAKKETKPLGDIKPMGQKRKYADPVLKNPVILTGDDRVDSYLAAHPDSGIVIGPMVRTSAEATNINDIKEQIAERAKDGNLPHSSAGINEMIKGGTFDQAALDATREKYHEEGYMEGKVDDDHVVFIKSKNWCDFYMALDEVKKQYAQDEAGRYLAADTLGIRAEDGDYDPCGRLRRDHTIVGDPYMPNEAGTDGSDPDHPTLDTFVTGEHSKRSSGNLIVDRAMDALREDRVEEAVKVSKKYSEENSEDAGALRVYAVALLRDGKTLDGVRRIAEAYTQKPELVWDPIEEELLGSDGSDAREIVQKVVGMARKSKGVNPSIAAVALLQATHKSDGARKMLEVAKDRGLSEGLVSEFSRALSESDQSKQSKQGAGTGSVRK